MFNHFRPFRILLGIATGLKKLSTEKLGSFFNLCDNISNASCTLPDWQCKF